MGSTGFACRASSGASIATAWSRPQHPLLSGINTRFDVPHSRYNAITREQFEAAGLGILIESAEAGVHAAVSADQFRHVYFQGHPEYDAISLLKEYKREVLRHFAGERDLPPYPDHYIAPRRRPCWSSYLAAAAGAHAGGPSAAGVSGSGGCAVPGQHLGRHRPDDL